MIPHRKTTPKITKEKETEFFPQQQISEGGKNSEGGKTKLRKHTIYPKQKTIKEKNKHLPVGSDTQQGSARDTRQENMRLIKQVQQQMNEK